MHDAHIAPTPTDDEAAAVAAAIAAYLAHDEQQPVEHPTASFWQRSAKLQTQGLQPVRTAQPLRWNTVERLRRMSGFSGVTGL